jgi:hypothetical protein
MAGDKGIRHRGQQSPYASPATRVQPRKGFGMYGLVIVVGFLTAVIGLVCMLANAASRSQEVPALWAIVAALGVLQICFGAAGSTLASLVRRKLPPPIPEGDKPLDADADLFDKPDGERKTSES